MPQAVSFVAAGVGLLIGGEGIKVALKIIAIALINVAASKLFAPKIPSAVASLRSKQTMSRSSTEYRKIVYGQAIVSGPIVYNNVSGGQRQYLWYVIALAHGESEDLVSVWFDGDEIPKADIDWTPGALGADGSGTGDVSTAKWIGENSKKAVRIQYYLGHEDQVASTTLSGAFGDWSGSHRGRGVTYLHCRLLYDQDTEDVWKSGPPNDIKAVIKGRKVYDPRADTTVIIDPSTSPITYGTGGQRYTDSTTWEWSDNPALCIADYLVNFMGADAATDIDWPSFADAADDCDVSVVIPPSASPENTETRFTCNGALSLGESHKSNLDALVSSCDGHLSYSQGQWTLRAGVWDASTTSIAEADIVSNVTVRGSAPKNERANTIRGVFTDPDRKYSPAEFPHVTSASYVTRDAGDTISYDLELPMTNSQYMAQRIAFRQLEQFNNQIVVEFNMNLKGANVQVGQVFDLTIDHLSWAAKTFRCIGWSRNSDGTFKITGREDSSASYDDPTVGEYTTGTTATTTVPADVVAPPTACNAVSVQYGNKISWTNPGRGTFEFVDVYASETSAWSGAVKIASVRTDTYTHSLPSGSARYYWVRARQSTGEVSTRCPDSDTSTVTATSGADSEKVTLGGAALTDTSSSPTDAEVAYKVDSDGDEYSYEGTGGTYASLGTWLLAGAAGDYDVRMTKNSGDNPTSGNLSTWEALSVDRAWVWTQSAVGTKTANCTVEIRENATGTVYASGSLTVDIEQQLLVGMSNENLNNYSNSSPCIANVKIDNDGSVYRSNAAGAYGAASQVWLDAGQNSDVWVERTIDAGSLDTDTIGASRVAMTSDRTVGVQDSNGSFAIKATATVTVSFYDAASGGNLLDTATITLTANYESLS